MKSSGSPIKEGRTQEDIKFSNLCEPDHSYTIQIDTPQPTLTSSPRQSVNPQYIFMDEQRNVPHTHLCCTTSHAIACPVYYPVYFGSSDETIAMSQLPSSAGYVTGIPQQINSSGRVYSRPTSSVRDYRPISNGWLLMAQPAQLAVQEAHQFQVSPPTPADSASSGAVTVPTPPVGSAGNTVAVTPTPIKRKRGRPRKIVQPEIITPEKTPAPTQSAPARKLPALNTSKAQTNASPTPTRKSTGCWTCKCRRKKCDEGFPACSMCTKLELPCLGFEHKKPECLSTPKKTEETRAKLAAFTKQRKENLKQARGLHVSSIDAPKLELFRTLGVENENQSVVTFPELLAAKSVNEGQL